MRTGDCGISGMSATGYTMMANPSAGSAPLQNTTPTSFWDAFCSSKVRRWGPDGVSDASALNRALVAISQVSVAHDLEAGEGGLARMPACGGVADSEPN